LIGSVADSRPPNCPNNTTNHAVTSRSIIHVKGLTIFHGFRPVLRDIDFAINYGEFTFLTGETGSGKTSLLKTLYADLPLKVGDAQVAGFGLCAIKRANLPFLRRKLGIIFQDFQLLMDRNVEENLWFVLQATGWKNKPVMRKKIAEVLMKVGLGWAGKKMVHQLSGGEQQRVTIARAILNDPLILLADEPTGNLDPGVALGILRLFIEINRGGTAVLMATHNYDLLEKHPARVLKCHNGALIDSHQATVQC
jgi:cell division transport system ATP-binding protein